MSAQSFEIRCPSCGSVVPADMYGCPNCEHRPASQVGPVRVAASEEARPAPPPDLASMSIKDYHRLVRANYLVTEGPHVARSGSRVMMYLPFVLLLIGILVGAAVIFHRI